ncbi:basic salivary proline-rich protein 1-like [Falco rusticolus]|uniref:basic salivary proline-rich protein 1-like n=1 Tax=Falco rusticolus TaxID=120794 RepID=UPI001886778E|nr:basic salivary proline-rich protein 1-like [Falco rusticolus]
MIPLPRPPAQGNAEPPPQPGVAHTRVLPSRRRTATRPRGGEPGAWQPGATGEPEGPGGCGGASPTPSASQAPHLRARPRKRCRGPRRVPPTAAPTAARRARAVAPPPSSSFLRRCGHWAVAGVEPRERGRPHLRRHDGQRGGCRELPSLSRRQPRGAPPPAPAGPGSPHPARPGPPRPPPRCRPGPARRCAGRCGAQGAAGALPRESDWRLRTYGSEARPSAQVTASPRAGGGRAL